ncbi:class I SAM-dependent methyltransferase [Stenotrophomonas terrae]|uniref:class I SAM-dependent methyltransferase n=1 Tax=Stenotrophomonas terrae TaxID=405446 RepID=UPI003209B426
MPSISEIAPNLRLDKTGIWSAASTEAISYPEEGNQACFELEESSFWFKHRNACITMAATVFPPANNGPIFDIGGGNGFVSCGLIKAGFETVLVEPGPSGAANGKSRGIPTVICATTTDAGFKNSTLDGVGLFDVIEHIEEDHNFLTSIRNLLKPNGRLYATVPTYSMLWSEEDELAGHFRRYTRDSICSVIEGAGLKIDYATYFFRPLPAPIFLLRSLPHRLGVKRTPNQEAANDHKAGIGAALMDGLLEREIRNISHGRTMSFGASCLVVASAR